MPEPFSQYLESYTRAPSFTDYISGQNLAPLKPLSFSDYLDEPYISRSVLPTIEDLKPVEPLGLGGALVSGLKGGVSLGRWGEERTPEEMAAMTAGESFAEAFGGIAGGAIPFIAASVITGGYGAPVAGAGYMRTAYSALRNWSKLSKAVKSLNKSKAIATKAVKAAKGKQLVLAKKKLKKIEDNIFDNLKSSNKYEREILGYKQKYIAERIEAGAKGTVRGRMELARLAKMPALPTARGLLGRSQSYQKWVSGIAQNHGFQWANVANRFVNSAGTFASVGLVSSKPGASILDRIADIPGDVAMGAFFTAAGMPRIFGVKGGAAYEPLGIMGIGAYSDYLTLNPDPDMDIRDRLIHGLALTTFHYVAKGLSNVGVKDQVFNALLGLGFDEPVAFEVAYKTKLMNDGLKVSRKEQARMGVLYQHNKDPKKMIAVTQVRKGGEEGESGGVISYRDMDTGAMDAVAGRTLTEARNKLQKRFHKFDPENKKLVDDLPEHMRENVDLYHALEKEIKSVDIERQTAKSKAEHEMWDNRAKALGMVINQPRMYTLKKVDPSEVEPDRTSVIDVRKDFKHREEWFGRELEFLDTLAGKEFLKNPDKFMEGQFGLDNWPERYKWMNHDEKVFLSDWISNLRESKIVQMVGQKKPPVAVSWGITSNDPKTFTRQLQRRIHEMWRSEALKDASRAVEKDFPATTRTYKIGEIIVIPKIIGHDKTSEFGTGKGFDNSKLQLARVIENDPKLIKPDEYVPVVNGTVIRVETVNLFDGKKVKLNIRTEGQSSISDYDRYMLGGDLNTQAGKNQHLSLVKENNYLRALLKEDPEIRDKAYFGKDSQGRPIYKWRRYNQKTQRMEDLISVSDYEALAEQLRTNPDLKREYDHIQERYSSDDMGLGYKEPSLSAKEFVNAEGPIEPEIYHHPMFENASRLTRGKALAEFWTPKLEYVDAKNNTKPFDLETFADVDRLIFDNKLEADRRMSADWQNQESARPVLESKQSRAEANKNRTEFTPEWSEFRKQENMLSKSFKNQGLDKWESKAIVDTIYPEVKKFRTMKEKMENLSIRQVSRIRNFIEEKNTTEAWTDSQMNITPDDWASKINPKYRKLANLLARVSLPAASTFESLGYFGAKIATSIRRFSRWRTNILGIHINTVNAMSRELKSAGIKADKPLGSVIRYVNKYIHAWMDKDYAPLQESPEYVKFRENMESVNMVNPRTGKIVSALEYTQEMYKKLYDQMALAQIMSNSFIKNTKKKGKSERFIRLHDMEGNEIELKDYLKNSDKYVKSAQSILDWVKDDKLTTIEKLDADGNLVKVKVDTKHPNHANHFEKDYSRRVLTDRLKEIITLEKQGLDEAVRHIAENDKDFQHIKDFEERKDAARAHLLSVKNMIGEDGVYGQQWTRIADLPAYFYTYILGEKMNFIQMAKGKEFKSDGSLYKEGDVIIDIHEQKRKVSEVIPTYETEYGKLLQDYSEGVAHSTASYFIYGSRHKSELLNASMANQLGKEMGDTYYENFANKVMKSQIFGEKERWWDKIIAPTVRLNAIVGLSSPISGLKNLLLGNVQNVTVFTSRELLKAAGHLFGKGFRETWKAEKEIAEKIGATYAGAYDLYLTDNVASGFMKRFLPNIGLMRTTEIMNRVISNTVGPFALDIHVANVAGIKTPSTIGLDVRTSRRVLMDVMEFSPEKIVDMIQRRRTSDTLGKEMQFTAQEETQARQQAHLITQGSGELPYVPYWMGKAWAKPLTLFYRIAYRITETVGKNVVKPIIVDGNMVPAMKYMTFATGAGYSLYQVYNYMFDEDRVNKFKSMPENMFSFFIKAEGLALFSNAFDEYGGVVDSYKPVVLRNTEEFIDELEAFVSGKKTAGQAAGDGLKRMVSIYNTVDRVYKMATQDTQKKFLESRRRQTQFLDSFYPKEKLDIDFDSALTSKSAYYRALKDVFWYDKMEDKALRYYSALSHLTHRIMTDNRGMTYRMAQKEARTRLKRTISRLRPIPTSWRKTRARTMGTRYREYMAKLDEGDRAEEEVMDSLYMDKRREFWQSIREYRNKYYKEG